LCQPKRSHGTFGMPLDAGDGDTEQRNTEMRTEYPVDERGRRHHHVKDARCHSRHVPCTRYLETQEPADSAEGIHGRQMRNGKTG